MQSILKFATKTKNIYEICLFEKCRYNLQFVRTIETKVSQAAGLKLTEVSEEAVARI